MNFLQLRFEILKRSSRRVLAAGLLVFLCAPGAVAENLDALTEAQGEWETRYFQMRDNPVPGPAQGLGLLRVSFQKNTMSMRQICRFAYTSFDWKTDTLGRGLPKDPTWDINKPVPPNADISQFEKIDLSNPKFLEKIIEIQDSGAIQEGDGGQVTLRENLRAMKEVKILGRPYACGFKLEAGTVLTLRVQTVTDASGVVQQVLQLYDSAGQQTLLYRPTVPSGTSRTSGSP